MSKLEPGEARSALEPYPPDELPSSLRGGIVAIGNFDGVHRGHASLLRAAVKRGADQAAPPLVLTFDPHPRTFFRPSKPVFRLTPGRARARLLQALGIRGLVVATFDASLAGMSAEMFIERILLAQLGIEGAVIGFNFRFGRGRLGTAETLAEAGQRLGFSVSILDQVGCADTVITSSAVRSGLRDGDILSANRLLGYRWFVIGDIVPGEKRGRELGYPTANIDLWPECDLRHGVYAVTLQLADGSRHDGVASFGRRPTFGEGKALLEVHAFDFDGDLYGQTVTVAFVDWLRPEQKFSSAADLVEAMNRDRDHAARKLAGASPPTGLDRALALVP